MKKRALSALLALCMTLALLPWAAVPARAEVTTQRKAFMLGASGIATGDTVYFGQQGSTNSDRYWRVLFSADESNRILLLSIGTKDTTSFGTSNTWAGSAAQKWCERFFDGSSFNDMDRAAIAETTVTDDDSTLYNGHTSAPLP